MAFPNVPNVPGVPALPRGSGAILAGIELLVADALSAFAFGAPQWGVFLNGDLVIQADSVVTFDFKQEFQISDYPVEEGAFQTYNKVQLPFDVRVRMATGGSAAARQAFINSVAAVVASLDLYDVVTPEVVYTSVNFGHQSYDRKASNVGLLSIDLWGEQVRVTATAAFSNTQQPSGAGQVNDGTVQPLAPTAPIPFT